jgi:hypothetical protein
MGDVGFEITSSEVTQLWALSLWAVPVGFCGLWHVIIQWALNYEVETNLFMLSEYLRKDRASCGLLWGLGAQSKVSGFLFPLRAFQWASCQSLGAHSLVSTGSLVVIYLVSIGSSVSPFAITPLCSCS